MSKDIILADAINLSQIASHPTEAMAALIEVVRRQGELLKEHEMRLDKHSERVDRLRFPEEKATKTKTPGRKQEDRLNRIEALLITRGNEALTFSEIGKYLELGSRTGKVTTRRQNMTILGRILAREKRFHVFNSETQKGAKMVCLAPEYFTNGKRV